MTSLKTMGETHNSPKFNIEANFSKGIMSPLMALSGRRMLNRLPDRDSTFTGEIIEHKYLGFWGSTDVVTAFRDIPELTKDPQNTMVISDMDGPFVSFKPHINQSGLSVFEIEHAQVEALEEAHTPNVYSTNRNEIFPGTQKLFDEMEALGVSRDRIFPSQDKESGVFRDKSEFERLLVEINKQRPSNLFLLFDMFNMPFTVFQDVSNVVPMPKRIDRMISLTPGHYLKDILHNLPIGLQEEMAIGLIGVNPSLKDTIYVPFESV